MHSSSRQHHSAVSIVRGHSGHICPVSAGGGRPILVIFFGAGQLYTTPFLGLPWACFRWSALSAALCVPLLTRSLFACFSILPPAISRSKHWMRSGSPTKPALQYDYPTPFSRYISRGCQLHMLMKFQWGCIWNVSKMCRRLPWDTSVLY